MAKLKSLRTGEVVYGSQLPEENKKPILFRDRSLYLRPGYYMNAKISQGHRVVTLLSREQIDFLDKISKEALFSTGLKLSRVKIISAFVNALRELGIRGEGVSSERELGQRIIDKIW